MTTYGFKYNGEGETIYYNTIEGVSLDMLIEGKYYSHKKDGCYLYIGTSTEETSELTFNCVGGPYDDSICSEEAQFVYHFVNGDCDSQQQTHYYYRKVFLNGVYITPEQNKYYKYRDSKGYEECYLYLGRVEESGQSVGNVRVLTEGQYDNCDCSDAPIPGKRKFEFEDCNGNIIIPLLVGFNVLVELISDNYYDTSIGCLKYIGHTVKNPTTNTINIIDGPFEDCDCEDKPEPPTTENSECVVSTCKDTEQHINVSNDILNLLDFSLSELSSNHTFKWNNKCYYIVEVIGEENPELPIMDIEHLNGVYPGCTECNNDGVKHKDNTEYYEKVNCKFADAVYNKAMSDRYGVEFCCDKDLQRLTIKKKLLDAGQIQDDIDLCEI